MDTKWFAGAVASVTVTAAHAGVTVLEVTRNIETVYAPGRHDERFVESALDGAFREQTETSALIEGVDIDVLVSQDTLYRETARGLRFNGIGSSTVTAVSDQSMGTALAFGSSRFTIRFEVSAPATLNIDYLISTQGPSGIDTTIADAHGYWGIFEQAGPIDGRLSEFRRIDAGIGTEQGSATVLLHPSEYLLDVNVVSGIYQSFNGTVFALPLQGVDLLSEFQMNISLVPSPPFGALAGSALVLCTASRRRRPPFAALCPLT